MHWKMDGSEKMVTKWVPAVVAAAGRRMNETVNEENVYG
jgi:hypothetical protein